jgi:DNA repair exonuclease SbcCD ATPase subunit
MNREFEKLLKEKWFLVAADLIAVMAILIVMPDKRDGFDTFLVICAILAASLIVVIPVLKDGGGKAERQAEQARLRAKLAEEIDLQRDNIRAGNEAMNRRIAEAEMTARKAAEASAAAVAQRASTEINALKAALAELAAKVAAAEAAAGSSEAVDELNAKIEDLTGTVRGLVADADEAAENAGMLRLGVAGVQALESEVKSVREELKKATKSADKAADKLEAALDSLREEVAELRSRPSAPAAEDEEAEEVVAAPVAAAPGPIAAAAAAESAPVEDEDPEDEEVIEEIDDAPEEAASSAADVAAPSAAGSGTALIVNLMIGIGNKPFVRGTGPGLSRDKGVPMSFLGIGRWQWISPDPEAPATVEVWKNDQSPMGEALHLSGGEPVEVDEGHFGGA